MLALFGCGVEARIVTTAVYLHTYLLLHIKVTIVPAFVALTACLVEDKALREVAKLAVEHPIRKDLFSLTRPTTSTCDIQYLVGFAGIALLAAKVEDASLWAVEAYLVVVVDKGSLKRAAGEVVGG